MMPEAARPYRQRTDECPSVLGFPLSLGRKSVERMARTAKDVPDFVPDEIFDLGPSRAEVLARIELLGRFNKDLANGGGHGQAQIGVDIDFGATDPPGHFNVRFRDPGGVLD